MTRTTNNDNWSLTQAWNKVAMKSEKPLQKRDYVYASELGLSMYDRYLKMNAVPYTTPPNERARRKFLAGNLSEYLVKQILVCSGVYDSEEMVINAKPYNDCLEVHGRCDFKTISGSIDYFKAMSRLNELALPEALYAIGTGIIESLAGYSMKEKILELKSVSSFAQDKVERTNTPISNHTLQGYHYQRNAGIEANIVYLCRDDLRMRQFGINATQSEPLYYQDLKILTNYYKKKKTPPLEPLAGFDEDLGKFAKNPKVEFSPYLTHYGFETPEHYRLSVNYLLSWNRTLDRYVLVESGAKTPTGKAIEITPKNKKTREAIEKAGYKFDKLLQIKSELGILVDEESE